MNFLLFAIIIFLWLAIFIKILDLTYLVQIKEYRRDRLFAFLKETGIGKSLYLNNNWHLPKKSSRNLIIILFSLILFSPLILFSLPLKITSQLGLVWCGFLIAPLVVGLGTALTAPLAFFSRQRTIAKAKKIIHGSKTVFIGITGSYGKTSVKEFLYQILKEKYQVERTEKNYNSAVGVALSVIKNLKKKTQFFIVEMGAYHQGEIAQICQLTPPRYGIVTAIGNQHQALFGSQEKLIQAKSELVQALPKNGRLYINQTIQGLKKIISLSKAPYIYFASPKKNKQTAIYLEKIKVNHQGSQAIARYQDKQIKITTSLLGKHNLINLLAPIALALDLNLTSGEVEKGISKIMPLTGKLSLHSGPKRSLILNDSLNSNQQGFIAALKTATLFSKKNLIVISKGITELGKEKKTAYQQIIKMLKSSKAILYTNDFLFKKLTTSNHQIIIFNNEKKLYNELIKKLNNQTLLLIEGKFTKNFLKLLTI